MKAWSWFLLGATLAAGGLKGPVSILDKDGRRRESLADCLAILDPTGPHRAADKRPLLRIKTAGKRFVPRVSWTTAGSEVAFPNQDHILHNVFSPCCANAFDTGHYEPGDIPRVAVLKPGLVKLYCNVHHSMFAFLWVVETPWVQSLDGRQGVEFHDVPPGRYRLRLWHPETGEKDWIIAIGEGTTTGSWVLSAIQPALEPHKNKFGKDYPPLKEDRVY
ncbi:MAG TPA: hypothetical protein VJ486_14420 [Geothrix sp.]|nr:hypothetical protein [Geothrix sp.]